MIVFKRARMALYFLLLFYSIMGCESMICVYQALAVLAGLLSLNEGALVNAFENHTSFSIIWLLESFWKDHLGCARPASLALIDLKYIINYMFLPDFLILESLKKWILTLLNVVPCGWTKRARDEWRQQKLIKMFFFNSVCLTTGF